MKTKERVLWSAAAKRADLPPFPRTASLLRHDAVPGRQLRCRTPKSAEQSENVDENKGPRLMECGSGACGAAALSSHCESAPS